MAGNETEWRFIHPNHTPKRPITDRMRALFARVDPLPLEDALVEMKAELNEPIDSISLIWLRAALDNAASAQPRFVEYLRYKLEWMRKNIGVRPKVVYVIGTECDDPPGGYTEAQVETAQARLDWIERHVVPARQSKQVQA